MQRLSTRRMTAATTGVKKNRKEVEYPPPEDLSNRKNNEGLETRHTKDNQ